MSNVLLAAPSPSPSCSHARPAALDRLLPHPAELAWQHAAGHLCSPGVNLVNRCERWRNVVVEKRRKDSERQWQAAAVQGSTAKRQWIGRGSGHLAERHGQRRREVGRVGQPALCVGPGGTFTKRWCDRCPLNLHAISLVWAGRGLKRRHCWHRVGGVGRLFTVRWSARWDC